MTMTRRRFLARASAVAALPLAASVPVGAASPATRNRLVDEMQNIRGAAIFDDVCYFGWNYSKPESIPGMGA